MCKFFSFLGDGYGNFKFLPASERKKILEEGSEISPDSHTDIADYYKIPEDKWSKYEYNPVSKEFTLDSGVDGHDHEEAKKWVERLDFAFVCPELVIKEVINPLSGEAKILTQEMKDLLEEWKKAYSAVPRSAWDAVSGAVSDAVWDAVSDAVSGAIFNAVWNAYYAYLGSFFKVKYKYDFSSGAKLWSLGVVPVFDGKKWSLISGSEAEVIYKEAS